MAANSTRLVRRTRLKRGHSRLWREDIIRRKQEKAISTKESFTDEFGRKHHLTRGEKARYDRREHPNPETFNTAPPQPNESLYDMVEVDAANAEVRLAALAAAEAGSCYDEMAPPNENETSLLTA